MSADVDEVLPLPPDLPLTSITAPQQPRERATVPSTAVEAIHAETTALHERFLRSQQELFERIGMLTAPQPREWEGAPARSGHIGSGRSERIGPGVSEHVFDPEIDTWLYDHAPTRVMPVLPATVLADRLAAAAQEHTGRSVLGLRDVEFRRWVTAPTTTRLRTEVSGPADEPTVTLSVWHEANTQALSRFVVAATGRVVLGDRSPPAPARFDPLPDARPEPLVYETGDMFHGPSLQYQESLRLGSTGSTAVITCDRDPVQHGILHPGVLDGCLHGVPGWSLHRWSPSLEPGMFGLPFRFPRVDLHHRLPTSGKLAAEARFVGSEDDDQLRPMVDFQLCDATNVLMSMRLVLRIIPHPGIWDTPLHRSRAFAHNREYVPEMLMSEEDGAVSVLRRAGIERADYVPGSIARMHDLPTGVRAVDRLGQLAAREHLARLEQVHPGAIALSDDLRTARCGDREYRLTVTESDESATARAERTA